MNSTCCILTAHTIDKKVAAQILFESFKAIGSPGWPTMEDALKEVEESCSPQFRCYGICIDDTLVGWAGLRPMYEKTWELHPLVIAKDVQHRSLGTKLLHYVEDCAKKIGIEAITLGSDDETGRTQCHVGWKKEGDSYITELTVTNTNNHPFSFYLTCGYRIVGIIPDANGEGKPDILMHKKLW